ncbi:MAG: hypothetical protein KJ767_00950 [Nanoarchaeota archaeon]|nr:hypothetical protein [Nanoarchaeota archaeon]
MAKRLYFNSSFRRGKVFELVEYLRENPDLGLSYLRGCVFESFYKWYQRRLKDKGYLMSNGSIFSLNNGERVFSFMLRETGIVDELTPEEKERWVYLDFNNVKDRMLEALILRDRYRNNEKIKPHMIMNNGKQNAIKLRKWYGEKINGKRRDEQGIIGYNGEIYKREKDETLIAFSFRETGMTRFLTKEEKQAFFEKPKPKLKWTTEKVIKKSSEIVGRILNEKKISLEEITFRDLMENCNESKISGLYPRLYYLKEIYIERGIEEVKTSVDAVIYAYCKEQERKDNKFSIDWNKRRKWIKKGRKKNEKS